MVMRMMHMEMIWRHDIGVKGYRVNPGVTVVMEIMMRKVKIKKWG